MRPLPGKAREEKTLKSAPRFFSFVVVAIVVLLDRLLKNWVLAAFPRQTSVAVFEPCFYLTRVNNTGAAFGMWRDSGKFLALFSILSILLILLHLSGLLRTLFHQTGSTTPSHGVAWALVAGGALGNWVDRMHYGYVIDYLDFRVWPVFNFADACISLGVAWIVFNQLFFHKAKS